MENKTILAVKPLGFPWQTQDPFLFCVHHEDFYPVGNDKLGPKESLSGRNLGSDFVIKDGWRMYHGQTVPGFPAHPHRGFETVTVVTTGLVDHHDSLGGAGRYGNGDVQWMTAGKGVQHAEMFPLLNKEGDNPFELFQIWLNLPGADKFVEPDYKMLWGEKCQFSNCKGANGKNITVRVVAGTIDGKKAPSPTTNSWAAKEKNEVAIWTIKMEAGAEWTLPAASAGLNRSLYYYQGATMNIAGSELTPGHLVELNSDKEVLLKNGAEEGFLLMLQGRPIGEPVAQYGPFVMNTNEEIQQAMSDYRRTEFGGWPWPQSDPTHGPVKGRFARLPDGKTITKEG